MGMGKKRFSVVLIFLALLIISTFVLGQSDIGIVSFTILSQSPSIQIINPQNTTYNYPYDSSGNYPIDLNVTSNFPPTGWWYVLEDLECLTTSGIVDFIPNTTINSYRGSNFLQVWANDSTNQEYENNVTFYINTTNHEPSFDGLSDEYLFCEGSSGSYFFYGNDSDGDQLTFAVAPNQQPFFLGEGNEETINICNELTIHQKEIFTGNLDEDDLGGEKGWKTFSRDYSVTDNGVPQESTQKQVNLTLIEINDKPIFENDLSVYTIWTSAPNNTFSHQVNVSDEESGDQFSGNLNMNVNFLNGNPFFDVNETGFINFSGDESLLNPGEESKVYDVSVCVSDEALETISPDVGFCKNEDGSDHSGLSNSVCDTFQITITNENRAPTIYPYYPFEEEIDVLGATDVYFNVSEFDPEGTTPSTYWYVDGQLAERDDGSLFDEFIINFGCDVGGLHVVKAEATDGELNDSVSWRVQVERVSCPSRGGGGGGGSGPRIDVCEPKWGCSDFSLCQNAELSRSIGILSGIDYRLVQEQCRQNFWEENICGYQLQTCIDVNNCNVTTSMPNQLRECHFSTAPSCSDGIKNCHDGSCEFLLDCGGPCSACTTCSDGIQNQGEAGIDCGGPCPNECPAETPRPNYLSRFLLYLLDNKGLFLISAIIVALLVILSIRLYKVYILERDVDKFEGE